VSDRAYRHRGGDEPLLGATIPEHFAAVVARFGDREAVVARPQKRRLRYAELSDQVDALARGLMAGGFARGDRIGVWSANNLEWILLQLATARIGAVLVNINPAYRPRELAYALRRSEVQGIFSIPSFRGSDYVAMLREVLPELGTAASDALAGEALPLVRRVVLWDPVDPAGTRRPAPGFTLWHEVLEAGRAVPVETLRRATADLDCDDPINIQFTSGTTGFPKAVVLSHHNILNNAWFAARAMHLDEHDRLCIPVPFYHCFGTVLANLLCFSVGACAVVANEHFDPRATLEAIAEERCSAVHGVPTMFVAILEDPGFAQFDLSSLRTGIMAGAPCPPALMSRVMDEMHCPEILIGYGETEASPLTHLTSRDDDLTHRTQTVGRNLPHQEVRVAEAATGRTLAVGEVGEVCFRGYHVMRGYYADPEATAGVIDDGGWLHSGDLGFMDANGYLRITGRLKEMIIRGGENLYPAEIEEVLFENPKLAQVGVFGVPDPFYGEQVVAWVQLHAGQTASEDDIRAWCRERLAHFKVPARIRFVDEFPMTVTGKLQKFRMREQEEALAATEAPTRS
jgi:fatty-acyl-CoA synthase